MKNTPPDVKLTTADITKIESALAFNKRVELITTKDGLKIYRVTRKEQKTA